MERFSLSIYDTFKYLIALWIENTRFGSFYNQFTVILLWFSTIASFFYCSVFILTLFGGSLVYTSSLNVKILGSKCFNSILFIILPTEAGEHSKDCFVWSWAEQSVHRQNVAWCLKSNFAGKATSSLQNQNNIDQFKSDPVLKTQLDKSQNTWAFK